MRYSWAVEAAPAAVPTAQTRYTEDALDYVLPPPPSGASDRRTLADGRYVLVREVAEGGTALVHLGFDTWTDQWRAVKTLLPEYAKRPALRHRFEREAATMKGLSHENIIAVYDAGVDDEVAFMVMEFAEGGSVIDWVERHGPMPPRMATEVVLQLCNGIEAAHRQGIIHRDVKPQNLLVDRYGRCKVTDFGIAQVVADTRMTMTGTVMGTVGYMAPEQHESAKHADERADVYSIAASFYTLLMGEAATHLFMAEPEDFEGIPEALAEVIRKGAEYRREARYPTVAALTEALHEALQLLPPDPMDTPPLVAADVPLLDDITPPSTSTGGPAPDPQAAALVLRDREYEPTPGPPPGSEPPIGTPEPAPEALTFDAQMPSSPGGITRRDLTQEGAHREVRPYGSGATDHQAGISAETMRRILLGGAALLGIGFLSVLAATLNARFWHGVYENEVRIRESEIVHSEGVFHNELNGRVYAILAKHEGAVDGADDLGSLVQEFNDAPDVQLARRALNVLDTEVRRDLCTRDSLSDAGDCKNLSNVAENLERSLRAYDNTKRKLNDFCNTWQGSLAGCLR